MLRRPKQTAPRQRGCLEDFQFEPKIPSKMYRKDTQFLSECLLRSLIESEPWPFPEGFQCNPNQLQPRPYWVLSLRRFPSLGPVLVSKS
jgi:hypothetical protein